MLKYTNKVTSRVFQLRTCHISCNHNRNLFFLEGVYHLVPLKLVHISMQKNNYMYKTNAEIFIPCNHAKSIPRYILCMQSGLSIRFRIGDATQKADGSKTQFNFPRSTF